MTSTTRTGESTSPRFNEPLHWACDPDLRVLTCRNGKAHVVAAERKGNWTVHLLVAGNLRPVGRSFGEWKQARQCGEQLAQRLGIDSLACPGPWRRQPASPAQRKQLKKYGVAFGRGITKGDAGDLIALSMARTASK